MAEEDAAKVERTSFASYFGIDLKQSVSAQNRELQQKQADALADQQAL